MNTLVYNKVADELHASVYGYNPNTATLALLRMDENSGLMVGGSVTIANTQLTVAGSVTVANTLTVLSGGNEFTSLTQTLANVTGTGIALAATDISTQRTATMFIYNNGSNNVKVTVQLSPDGTEYFNDPSHNGVSVGDGERKVIVLGIFAKYAQLTYDAGNSASFIAYYNGQA